MISRTRTFAALMLAVLMVAALAFTLSFPPARAATAAMIADSFAGSVASTSTLYRNQVLKSAGNSKVAGGGLISAVNAVTSAATIALDPTTGDVQTLVPAHTATINIANGVRVANQRLTLVITTSGTTSYTLTFGTNFKSAGTLATGTTDAKVFTITFISNGTTYTEVARTAAM